MTPLVLTGDPASPGEIEGVNAVDINPAHQLVAFGIDGAPLVEYWDPRSRTRAGVLRLPESQIPLSLTSLSTSLSVTALASRQDGLSMAVGSSSGFTLLYDLRSTKPFAIKDQGYGLPIKEIQWVERVAAGKVAGDGYVMSADKKVLKIWDRNDVSLQPLL
jgi:ribosome biogenesis protein ENP2